MGGSVARTHPDVKLADLATRQHGVVSRRQLRATGMSEAAIKHRVAVRRLHRMHRGVYAVGHPHLTAHGRYLAAVLACGGSAVLSHRSAADLWELRPSWSPRLDVTLPSLHPRRRSGIAVHATRSLPRAEVTVRHGIPCTTPARTIVDLAASLRPGELLSVLERSVTLGLFDGGAIDAVLGGGRSGTATLRRLLAELRDEASPVRRELERRFLELVRAADLPTPIVNGRVEEHEVDFHWPAQRLVVETDGHATHATLPAFHRDRGRDLDLELAGWHVLRFGWRQVVHEPDRVTALLLQRHRELGVHA